MNIWLSQEVASFNLYMQELTLNHANIVNAKKNMELVYGENTFLGAHLKWRDLGLWSKRNSQAVILNWDIITLYQYCSDYFSH